jgi:methionine synthase II (cobalamin-independent)
MTAGSKPPFRADHVGSLLRPKSVAEARDRAAKGEIGPEALRAVEDAAIRDAIKLQESVGLQSITDGEFRRAMWHTDFLLGIEGVAATHSSYAVSFQNDDGETTETSSMLVVRGKVRRTRPIMVDHFKFVRANTDRTAKLCIPAPTYLHMRGGREIVDRTAYPDMDAFWDDMVAVYRAEIADLVAAGCTYLQFDDVSFACLCDAGIRDQVKRDGEDPDALPKFYSDVINRLIAGRPPSLAVTIHTCRGNFQSMWMAEGGYEAVAEATFNTLDVDGFFLEYDTARAGGFKPLRFMPRGKKVVLGLVSTKLPGLESKDDIKRRIEEASRYVALEDLCLSPQCGFASSHAGNRITEEVERAKLALVVEVAREVWG